MKQLIKEKRAERQGYFNDMARVQKELGITRAKLDKTRTVHEKYVKDAVDVQQRFTKADNDMSMTKGKVEKVCSFRMHACWRVCVCVCTRTRADVRL